MLQAISRAERLNMIPEDYCLRKQFLLKDIKEEISLVISLMRNNPYSSDLLEYVKAIQMEISELGYFCILPNPSSPNATEYYERTLSFLNTISEKDCISLSADQYANIDVFYTLKELMCKNINTCNNLLIQFLPNKEKVETEIRRYNRIKIILSKAIITSLTGDDTEVLSKYFIKYTHKITELKQRIAL